MVWDVSHIKIAIVDNTIFLPASKLVSPDMAYSTDMIAKLEDKELADKLEAKIFGSEPIDHEPIITAANGAEIDLVHNHKARSKLYAVCDAMASRKQHVWMRQQSRESWD